MEGSLPLPYQLVLSYGVWDLDIGKQSLLTCSLFVDDDQRFPNQGMLL